MVNNREFFVDINKLFYPLRNISKPARYIGGEPNQPSKEELLKKRFRAVLCYPDLYELGMSYPGLHILLEAGKKAKLWAIERAFMPSPEVCTRFREYVIPLFSLETKRPLKSANVVGFSLQTETTYTNILEMLELSQIPLFSEDRGEEHPIIIAGGALSYHPEVMAPYFDIIVPGDGEEAFPSLLNFIETLEGINRKEKLVSIARKFKWAYIPSLYYIDNEKIEPCYTDIPMPIKPALFTDLNSPPFPQQPIVSIVQSIHDRVTVEIMRGCVNGCRFCEAGMTKRPLRFRSKETILKIGKNALDATGYDEISLLSLSSSDHPQLKEIMDSLHNKFSEKKINISLPSLRVDKDLIWLPEKVKRIRKSILTLAPEAGTERLRKVINKPISNHDLIKGAETAWIHGWTRLKLYFMIGLPTEKEEDIIEIVKLSEEVSKIRKMIKGSPGLVNVTISTFVPRPWTPFQWEAIASIEEIYEKQKLIKASVKMGSVKFKFHNPERSHLEAVLGRGGRKVGNVVREARRMGAHMDGWDEYFDWSIWLRAFEKCSVDPHEEGLAEKPLDKPLPWDHISFGISKSWLISERKKAYKEEITPSCLDGPCSLCGLDPSLCKKLRRNGIRN